MSGRLAAWFFIGSACLSAWAAVAEAQPTDVPTGPEAEDPAQAEEETEAAEEAEEQAEAAEDAEDSQEEMDEAAAEAEDEDEEEGGGEDEEDPNRGMGAPGATVPYGYGATARAESRFSIPPFETETRGDVSTTSLFPFYYSRRSRRQSELLVGPYYQLRGADGDADVVFPFFWSYRDDDDSTLVIPPVWYHSEPYGFDLGIAPLFMTGRDGDESGKASVYTVIPPLLTVSWANDERARTFAGPFWRFRQDEDVDWGVFPFVWVRDDDLGGHAIVAPFFWRFVDREDPSALTVIPPVYHRVTRRSAYYGFAGLFHHYHDENSTSLTVPPLIFHFSEGEDAFRLVTPLFAWLDVEDHQTLITPLYQRHRGDTELDAVAPIFFSWRDPREHASSLTIAPIFHHYSSPAASRTFVLPLFGHWHESGRYSTIATPLFAHWESHTSASAATWIFPNLQFSHTPTSNTINIHPLVYSTSARTHRHFVFAPLYWDFEDYEDESRTTIFFPLFWRFRSGASVTQVAGNTYYRYGRSGGVPFWEFHFFPFFAYGEPRPGDHWWSVLYGLVGYERAGRYARTSMFWIPIQTDGPEE